MLAEKLQPETPGIPEALQIYVSRGRDGDGYEVDYFSRQWLQKEFPGVRVVPTLYLGHKTRRDMEPQLENILEQVVILLTGVSSARLAERGITRISFLDPSTDTEFEGYPISP